MDLTNALLTVAVVAAAIALNQYVVGPAICRWFGDTDADDQDPDATDATDQPADQASLVDSDDEDVDEEPVATVTGETLGTSTAAESVDVTDLQVQVPSPVLGHGVRRPARRVVARPATLAGRN